nr:hypothetical protein [Tanacetum cinerariifolium]
MDEDLRESYRTLEQRLFHEGRFVTPSFIKAKNMLPSFQDICLEPFLTLNEPICPRFVVEFYHSLEVKRDEEERPYIEFKLGQFTFELDLPQLSPIFQTPYTLKTFYTNEWSLNSLDNHPNSRFFCPKHDLRMKQVTNKYDGPMPFVMLLTRLYNHILQINPQSIIPLARFTFHERVMNPLYITRNPRKEKGKKVASPSVTFSSSSSSDDNKAPSFLEFYEELSDNEDLTNS